MTKAQTHGTETQPGKQDEAMSEQGDKEKKVLSLSSRGKLELKSTAGANVVKQSFSHGRSKAVSVEVKRKRTGEKEASSEAAQPPQGTPARATVGAGGMLSMGGVRSAAGSALKHLTAEERESRDRALRLATLEAEQRALAGAAAETLTTERQATATPEPQPGAPATPEQLRQREIDELKRIQEVERTEAAERKRKIEESRAPSDGDQRPRPAKRPGESTEAATTRSGRAVGTRGLTGFTSRDEEDDGKKRGGRGRAAPGPSPRRDNDRRTALGKLRVTDAAMTTDDDQPRGRSMAAIRRAHERERRRAQQQETAPKVSREVVVPETITVQEFANRMAERGSEIIKILMKMGVMATITETIDADTAELVAAEFGHRIKRVADSDVELGIEGIKDEDAALAPRPPVVTIMGHVDHGKTSLLDALRQTSVAAGEAGGITQHIGAYQISVKDGRKITFIDTPGHAAFTEMRARGANITDIVILVVAADDSVMPQTIEAIKHAKAAEVPIIVAINKCDLPAAKPDKVRQELLQHDIQVEEMGGEVLSVEISAKTKKNLDKFLEAILLQADVLDLKANPVRAASGHVVESRVDRGRGSVATVLIENGTLRVGDIFVAGHEWGKVRALLDDRGTAITQATPAMPVEVLGLTGTPDAGDSFIVVENEAKAREISEFRKHRNRAAQAAAHVKAAGGVENMLVRMASGNVKELAVIIKGDVHGSIEAIKGALEKAGNEEVRVRVLDSSVGAISEADVNLAHASGALIIGFNVRANPQARELAKRDAVEIRYYPIIYTIIDDVKAMLSGMLSPVKQEKFLGYAEILQIFNITKVGKVAGCRVTEGVVKRGSGVRLLRDNIVIHQGTLRTLKRIKDEVREVKEGYECGMAFENYDNIEVGDRIECFEVEEIARTL